MLVSPILTLSAHEEKLQQWLDNGYHGEMDYMQKTRHDARTPRRGYFPERYA